MHVENMEYCSLFWYGIEIPMSFVNECKSFIPKYSEPSANTLNILVKNIMYPALMCYTG